MWTVFHCCAPSRTTENSTTTVHEMGYYFFTVQFCTFLRTASGWYLFNCPEELCDCTSSGPRYFCNPVLNFLPSSWDENDWIRCCSSSCLGQLHQLVQFSLELALSTSWVDNLLALVSKSWSVVWGRSYLMMTKTNIIWFLARGAVFVKLFRFLVRNILLDAYNAL